MNSIFEVLYCRRPVLNYVCPPVCEVLFSGSGFPVIVLGDFSSLVAPGGVRFGGFGGFRLFWNEYPGALCYNIYRAETDEPNAPLVLIVDCHPGTDIPLPPGCYRISAITRDGETALSNPPVCYLVPPMLPPEVTTNAASNVSATQATLNGTINAVGQASTAYFEWGTTLAYGSTTPVQNTGNTFNDVPYNAIIGGLSASTLYHFRAIGFNTSGEGDGADMTFTTDSGPSAFWNLSWDIYQENLGSGATVTRVLSPASFYVLLDTPPGGASILEYNGDMTYTGVEKIAHLHIIVSNASAIGTFGVIRFFVDSVQVFAVFAGDLLIDGTYDYDFTIPESVGALIECYMNISNGDPALSTTLQWTATLTAIDA